MTAAVRNPGLVEEAMARFLGELCGSIIAWGFVLAALAAGVVVGVEIEKYRRKRNAVLLAICEAVAEIEAEQAEYDLVLEFVPAQRQASS